MLTSPELLRSPSQESINFNASLRNDITTVLPEVKKGINILLEGEVTHHERKENVLFGHVCGRAVRVLGYFLRHKGYNALGFKTSNLGIDYPTRDHAILKITDTPNGVNAVVDAAYLQFLRMFYLSEDQMPSEEVLVFPESDIQKKAEELAGLREIKLKSHPDPEVFKDQRIFQISKPDLIKYFQKIWDPGLYTPITHNLETDILDFQSDPQKVSVPTRKLIEELRL